MPTPAFTQPFGPYHCPGFAGLWSVCPRIPVAPSPDPSIVGAILVFGLILSLVMVSLFVASLWGEGDRRR